MIHPTIPWFWKAYRVLPAHIQRLADENFGLLKADPRHPSLHLKRVGRFWSVRVGRDYRALGVDRPDGIYWFWIGSHDDYDRLIK